MKSDIPLREIKKARNKIALYEACLTLIAQKASLREVMLEDICRLAEVSRVTFFKFYQRKEDLLVYFMRVWLTERIAEIETNGMRGFEAVRHLFRKAAEVSRERPSIMASLVSFLAETKMHPCMPEMSAAEICLLFPEYEEIGARTPHMHRLFYRCMEEAREEGRLNRNTTPDTAVKVLFTVFYGAFLTAQAYGEDDFETIYEIHLRWIENA
ncbi:TetR/AcrR family transcriptional regulator [Cohnella massiliensis]|uniref:TetR/AcrR family transcriptional regulator n=1 Tax=Cohnella massiliensis TaxID=1816691 RepID=UPI0009B993D6|nr:TetR family transcriptional regulator [Cohnella massiliensis]